MFVGLAAVRSLQWMELRTRGYLLVLAALALLLALCMFVAVRLIPAAHDKHDLKRTHLKRRRRAAVSDQKAQSVLGLVWHETYVRRIAAGEFCAVLARVFIDHRQLNLLSTLGDSQVKEQLCWPK